MIATVILEHIDTPFSKTVCIIDLMIERSSCCEDQHLRNRLSSRDTGHCTSFSTDIRTEWEARSCLKACASLEIRVLLTETCTCHLTGTAVHAIFESLAVQMIRDRLQSIGKLAELGLELAVLVTATDILPAIVQYNMVVSKVAKP